MIRQVLLQEEVAYTITLRYITLMENKLAKIYIDIKKIVGNGYGKQWRS